MLYKLSNMAYRAKPRVPSDRARAILRFFVFLRLSFRLEALKSNPPFFVAFAGTKPNKWYFQCWSCERRIGDNDQGTAECKWRLRVSREAPGFLFHCAVAGPDTGHLPTNRMTGRLQGMYTASEERAVYDLVKSVGPATKTSDVRCAIHQAATRPIDRQKISHHAIMGVREKVFRYTPKKSAPFRPPYCCCCAIYASP